MRFFLHKFLHKVGIDIIRYKKPLDRNDKETERLNKQHSLFANNGLYILQKIQTLASSLGKDVWLEFGTLLGAYRDSDFISHDYDIDIGMNADDYDLTFENSLLKEGFVKQHFFYQYRSDDKPFLTEITWSYKGLNIDIFLSFPCEEKRLVYCYGKKDEQSYSQNKWLVREYSFPSHYPLEIVSIQNVQFRSTAHIEAYLTICYGENYMIPDPLFSGYICSDSMKIWDLDTCYAKITRL